MRARSLPSRSALRLGATVLAVGAFLLVPVAPGFADPGTPGVDRASTAVYLNTDQPPTLGENQPVSQNEPPNEGGTPVVDESPGTLEIQQGGSTPADSPQSFVADSTGGGADESLPFTGLSAALVLGTGLVALLLGLMVRAAAERLRRA